MTEVEERVAVALERIAVALEKVWHPSDIIPANDEVIDVPAKAVPYTLAETQEKVMAFCRANKGKVQVIQKWMQDRAATSLKDLSEDERGDLIDAIASL